MPPILKFDVVALPIWYGECEEVLMFSCLLLELE